MTDLKGHRANDDLCEARNRLLGALVGLARSEEGNRNRPTEATHRVLLLGLLASGDCLDPDAEQLLTLTEEARKQKEALVPRCLVCKAPCGRNDDFDMAGLFGEGEEQHNLKLLLLYALRGMAESALLLLEEGQLPTPAAEFFYRALFQIGRACNEGALDAWLAEARAVNRELLGLVARYRHY